MLCKSSAPQNNSYQFISITAQSGSSAKPIATVLFTSTYAPFMTIPCLSKTLLIHSSRFRYISCPRYSVTTLVGSMFFPRNSSFFQTILWRVNSMRFLCYSQPFESFLRLHTTLHCPSIPLLNFAALHFAIAEPIIAVTTHRKASLSPIYQTSRLSRSCCSQVSGSLAVCSSRQGNLCSRC